MSSNIAKNTIFLTSASVAQKIFSFIYFTLLARFIGVENTGLYITALSFSSLFSVLTDLGLNPVLIREGAKDNQNIAKVLGNILTIKLFLVAAAYGVLNLVVYLMGYGADLKELILISGLIMVLDSFSLSFYGALRSLQNLRFESIGVAGGQLMTVIVGFIVLYFKGGVMILLLALASGSLFNALWGLSALIRRYHIWPRFFFTPALLKRIIYYAAPFALAGIFVKVYSYVDVVMLSKMLGSQAVGWYGVAAKITFAFQFIPMAFAASLYPAMSNFFVYDKDRLKMTFEKGMLYLAMLALPIGAGLIAIAGIFVTNVYGASYQSSVLPLQIMAGSLIFSFLGFPIGSLLNACHRQNIQTSAMGATMVINIVMNLILIPWIGIIGSAIAALVGNFLLMLIGFFWVPKIITMPDRIFWLNILKVLLSSAIMGLLVWIAQPVLLKYLQPQGLAKSIAYLGILILFGVVMYACMLWVWKLVSKKDLILIFRRN
ncbi:MAG: flippase [Candidatus Magasanikbacteria bacterium]|nr:flippase [Candidatus Magasanikbacteria bacterium]